MQSIKEKALASVMALTMALSIVSQMPVSASEPIDEEQNESAGQVTEPESDDNHSNDAGEQTSQMLVSLASPGGRLEINAPSGEYILVYDGEQAFLESGSESENAVLTAQGLSLSGINGESVEVKVQAQPGFQAASIAAVPEGIISEQSATGTFGVTESISVSFESAPRFESITAGALPGYLDAAKGGTITTHLSLNGLYPGAEYRTVAAASSEDGGQICAANEEFTAPESGTDDLEIVLEIPAGNIPGQGILVSAALEIKIADEWISAAQTQDTARVHLVGMSGRAVDKSTERNTGKAGESSVSVSISYDGLAAGKVYTLNTEVFDKVSGAKTGSAGTSFRASGQTGTVTADVPYTAEAGHVYYISEAILYEGSIIAGADGSDDENQTIYVPALEGRIEDANGGHDLAASGEMSAIADISMGNLPGGPAGTVEARIVDAASGETAVDDNGKPLIWSGEASEQLIAAFNFVGESLAGHRLYLEVVLKQGDNVLAVLDGAASEHLTLRIPKIKTSLSDKEGGQDVLAEEGMNLEDCVSLEGLIPGECYVLKGRLLDKETGKPATDRNGNEIIAETSFVAESESSEQTVVFNVDGTNLAGSVLVAYEELYRGEKFVGSHSDLNDEAQMVKAAKITATLCDIDGTHDAKPDAVTKLISETNYSNLIPGADYEITVWLEDACGNKIVDAHGNEAAWIGAFTADDESGTVKAEFSFDASEFAGNSIHSMAQIKRNGRAAAVYEGSDKEAGTVYFPAVSTVLSDGEDPEREVLAQKGMMLKDTVAYKNLIPGTQYLIGGRLLDAAGAALLDDTGNEITAQTSFIAEEPEGEEIVTFCFDGANLAGRSFFATESLYRGDKLLGVHGDKDDALQKAESPKVKGVLRDDATGDKDLYAGDISMTDTVKYSNVIPGEGYVLVAALMDVETGEAAIDDNGEIIQEIDSFTAPASEGSREIKFNFKGTKFSGKTLVAFERLYRNGKLVAQFCSVDDADRSAFVPGITTELTDKTGGHDSAAAGSITLVDVINYKHMLPDTLYFVRGTLYDRETAEPVLDAKGEKVTVSAEFVPESSTGSVSVEFFIENASHLAGKTVVAQELIYKGSRLIAKHDDMDDESQTVYIAKVSTGLTDADGEKEVYAGEEIKLIDVITYENLIPGEEYMVKGRLMSLQDDKEALDDSGREITSEVKFMAQKSNGSISAEFVFSGKALAGKTLVAYEEVFHGDKTIASHMDPNDELQSVKIPDIVTELTDITDNGHDAKAQAGIRLSDTIGYSNLKEGSRYVIEGVLYNRATGEIALDDTGKEIRAGKAFTAETADGEISLEYDFDGAGQAGVTLVAFEKMYRDGKLIASHEDINDKEQSVGIAKIATRLSDSETGLHTALLSDNVNLTDRVHYEGLIAGGTYVLEGVLYDKTSGSVLKNADGCSVTGKTQFTAKSSTGDANVFFELDNLPESGLTVAARETFYRVNGKQKKELAVHADDKDMQQVAAIPAIVTDLTAGNGLKAVNGYRTMVLHDWVCLTNLYPGSKYELAGTLMDGTTGEPVRDAQGNEVTSRVELTDVEGSMQINLAFEYNAPQSVPDRLVAFEKLYEDGRLVACHENISEPSQTVSVFYIRTNAADEKGLKIFDYDLNNVIYDEVSYDRLDAGREYILRARLMDQETGREIMIGSDALIGESRFTAEGATGVQTVQIRLPARTFTGNAVVFEQLIDAQTGRILCAHEDITDPAQTVYIASAVTSAAFLDGSNRAELAEERTIVDKITYKGLQLDREYVISDVLVSKATGKVVTSLGRPITSDVIFIPEESSGNVEARLNVPLRTINGEAVCFVTVTDKMSGKVVCSHQDIEDKAQTVEFYYDKAADLARTAQNTGKDTNNGSKKSNASAVQTGDESGLDIWFLTVGAALTGILIAVMACIKRRKGPGK